MLDLQLDELIGKTLVAVTVSEDKGEIDFKTDDGRLYRLYHSQD